MGKRIERGKKTKGEDRGADEIRTESSKRERKVIRVVSERDDQWWPGQLPKGLHKHHQRWLFFFFVSFFFYFANFWDIFIYLINAYEPTLVTSKLATIKFLKYIICHSPYNLHLEKKKKTRNSNCIFLFLSDTWNFITKLLLLLLCSKFRINYSKYITEKNVTDLDDRNSYEFYKAKPKF